MRKWSLYICRDTFTDVMSALQIKLFMQNKANFRKVKLNVNNVLTKDYEQMDTWSIGKKQSQTKPNKAKFKKAKMNVTPYITVAYGNKPPIGAPKKQSQTSKRQKPMQTLLPQRIMKKTAILGYEKTNPIQTQFLPAISVADQTAHCEIGLLSCILCVDMAGLRRKHVTYYPGRVYNRMMWLAGSQRPKESRSKKHVVLLWCS
jgi:hypothetical protein